MKHPQQMKHLWEVSSLFHLLKMFHLMVEMFHLFCLICLFPKPIDTLSVGEKLGKGIRNLDVVDGVRSYGGVFHWIEYKGMSYSCKQYLESNFTWKNKIMSRKGCHVLHGSTIQSYDTKNSACLSFLRQDVCIIWRDGCSGVAVRVWCG